MCQFGVVSVTGGGLFDRPILQSGHRERKKTDRLELKYSDLKDKKVVDPDGSGNKLGDSPKSMCCLLFIDHHQR